MKVFLRLKLISFKQHASNITKNEDISPRLTKLFFVTRLTGGGGVVTTPSLDFPNRTPYEIDFGINSLRYGPSLSIHTKMSTIGQGVT